MEKLKPIYRFTLIQNADGNMTVVRDTIKDYYEVSHWSWRKLVFRYRDEKSHCLRDIRADKLDTLLNGVVYSYSSDMKKALKVMLKRTKSEVATLEENLAKKKALQESLNSILKQYPKK